MFSDTQPRLSDGRRIRALEDRVTQRQMFGPHKICLPLSESIMCIRDLDDACNISGGWNDPVSGCWRSGRYGVHARGFERLDRPIGSSVVWIEEGSTYRFEVPDVRHPNERGKSLRDACGLLDFPIQKLVFDDSTMVVSVAQGFDPETDVIVRDVRRSRGWALQSADGYPSRSMPSESAVPQARFSCFAAGVEFEGASSGWHGSIIYGDVGKEGDYRLIGGAFWEAPSAVGLVSIRQANGPRLLR